MRASMVALSGLLVIAACSGDGGAGSDERQAAIYSSVIASVAGDATTPTGDPFDGPVYVIGVEGNEIGIELQADIIDDLDDLAVTFVDARDEAIEGSDDTAPVLDGGLLLTLGRIRGSGPERSVPVTVYQAIGNEDGYTVIVQRRDDRWEATGTSLRTS